MAGEEDAVHVPRLALEPVGTKEERGDGGNGGHLVGVGLHPDPGVVLVAEEVVHHLKAEGLPRVIHPGHIHHLLELGLGVIPQETTDKNQGD